MTTVGIRAARALSSVLIPAAIASGCGLPAASSNVEEVEVVAVSVVLDGTDESALQEPLARIRAAVAVDDSTLALFDAGTRRVVVVRQSGHVVSYFGRSGEGPGEFRDVSELGTRDGLIFAYDQQLRRITSFTLHGEAQYSLPAGNQSLLAGRNLRILDSGHYAIRDLEQQGGAGVGMVYRVADRLGAFVRETRMPQHFDRAGLPDIMEFPFEPYWVTTLTAEGHLVLARTDRYEILVHSRERVDTIVAHRDPVRVLPDEARNYQTWADHMTRARSAGPRREVRATKPPLRGIWTASDGSLVIELHTEGVLHPVPPPPSRVVPPAAQLRWTEPPAYDVYTRDRAFVGRVTLPLRARLLDARLPFLWISVLDSLDVPRVEHWTIRMPAHDQGSRRPP